MLSKGEPCWLSLRRLVIDREVPAIFCEYTNDGKKVVVQVGDITVATLAEDVWPQDDAVCMDHE